MGYREKRYLDSKNKRIGEEIVTKYGQKCKIIDYIRYDDITVEFDNGMILKNVNYLHFKDGKINGTGKQVYKKRSYLTGRIIGNLFITSVEREEKTDGGRWECYYNCKCDCGKEIIRSTQALMNKTTMKICDECRILRDSIYTTNPELIKYFKNIEDSKLNAKSSNKEVCLVCDKCGSERISRIDSAFSREFKCLSCDDGISYPEKFMVDFFNQLNVKFTKEKRFEWANGKRYDFYIPTLSLIVETHGLQHYKEKFNFKNRSTKLEEEIENDRYKKENAINNGIKYYIELDCRESNKEYISNSIFNSELKEIFDIEIVDFDKCCKNANNSMLVKVCNYWNNLDIKRNRIISDEFNLDMNTVVRYLKIGNELNMCEYDAKSYQYKHMDNSRISNLNKRKIR